MLPIDHLALKPLLREIFNIFTFGIKGSPDPDSNPIKMALTIYHPWTISYPLLKQLGLYLLWFLRRSC
jgi:hypothetical protein